MKTLLNILICLIFFASKSFAQYYDISHFTVKDGLVDNHCSKLYCDEAGNLWAASRKNGLTKLTGNNVYAIDKQDNISDNRIFDIISYENALWFATGKGINRYNGHAFEALLTEDDSAKISAFAKGDTALYFYHFNKGIGMIYKGQISWLKSKKLSGLLVNQLLIDSSQEIYVGTQDKGFLVIKGNKTLWFNKNEGLPDNEVYSFYPLSEAKVLIATAKGVRIFDGHKVYKTDNYQALEGKKVYCISSDLKKGLWFGTNQGAYQIAAEKILLLNENNGLSTPVYSIVEDLEQGIWFGTGSGIFRLNNEFLTVYTTTSGLLHNDVYGILLDKKNQLWIGSPKGINTFFEGKIKTILRSSPNFKPLLHDSKKNIWSSTDKALDMWRDGKLVRSIPTKVISNKNYEYFNAAIELSSGEILFGGNDGLKSFDGNKLNSFISKKDLQGSTINAIIQSSNGIIWIGTEGQGLFKLDKQAFNQFTAKNGLPNNIINSFALDQNDNLWVGTSGNGVFKIRQSNTHYGFTRFDDLSINSSNVYALYCDRNNDIWAGTNRGLNKITIYENDLVRVNNYEKIQAFNRLQVNHNTITGDRENHIYVGTHNGLAVINYNEHIFSAKGPKVQISDVKLFYQTVNWQDITDDIVAGSNIPKSATLSSHQDHLTIIFEAIHHNIPQMITYQWKLEGFETSWSKATKSNIAIYRGLPAGNYTFMVRACNGAGICSENPAEFSFEINEPFYQTRVFIIGLSLVTIVIVVCYTRQRMIALKNRQEKLERQVRIRTAEIEEQKSKIEIQTIKISKALKEIDRKNSELTKVNDKITGNIIYARKIQDAIIFSEDIFKKMFPKSFVFLKRKSIVTSDFYWAWEVKNSIFIALADCTGHGVPGALMSLIGSENLKHILKKDAAKSPAEILVKFNEKISSTLNTTGATKQLNAGMDTALCKIDKKTHQMTFAGAGSRLIYVQNNNLELIKGDFASIGLQYKGLESKFTNHTIDLSIQTNIYLFSDGFYNQFRGEDNKKYKLSSFKKFIDSISSYNFHKQQEMLDQELRQWKQDADQTDDILIIGMQYSAEEQLVNKA